MTDSCHSRRYGAICPAALVPCSPTAQRTAYQFWANLGRTSARQALSETCPWMGFDPVWSPSVPKPFPEPAGLVLDVPLPVEQPKTPSGDRLAPDSATGGVIPPVADPCHQAKVWADSHQERRHLACLKTAVAVWAAPLLDAVAPPLMATAWLSLPRFVGAPTPAFAVPVLPGHAELVPPAAAAPVSWA